MTGMWSILLKAGLEMSAKTVPSLITRLGYPWHASWAIALHVTVYYRPNETQDEQLSLCFC